MARELAAERRVREEPAPLVERLRHERTPEGVVLEIERRGGEIEPHLERPASDLRDHHQAAGLELGRVGEQRGGAARREGVVEQWCPRHELVARLCQPREEALLRALLVRRADRAPRRHLDHAAVERAERLRQREQLVRVGDPARRRGPVAEEVRGRKRRRPADGTGFHRVADERGHAPALLGRRGTLDSRAAHRPEADRRMADERRDVDARAGSLERGEIAGEILPCPANAHAQRLDRHPLDEEEQLHKRLAVRGPAGRDRESAVPGDDGRHAVPGRRGGERVPEELAVVVGVEVDEARREDEAGTVDLGRPALRHPTDGDDPVAHDREVTADGLGSRPVAERRAADDEVGHGADF